MAIMQINSMLLNYDLQMFTDGAASGAGDGQGVESALPKAETNARRGGSRRARSGDYKNVVFGKQDAATVDTPSLDAGGNGAGNAKNSGVETTSNTLEEKNRAFKNLIEGEYKQQYTEMFQKTFNKRFAEAKEMEKTIASQKPIVDMLMQKYKVDDPAKLLQAIEQDDTYWEKAAEDAGMSIDQFKSYQKLQRDSDELKKLRQRQAGEQQAQQQLSEWYKEAEELKSKYPSFNFREELQNRDFVGMLRAGVSVENAFKTLHMDEINAATAKAAAQTASQQMAANIKAKAERPQENGTSRKSAAIVKSDVHSLSKEDRQEVIRRVMRGEKISF